MKLDISNKSTIVMNAAKSSPAKKPKAVRDAVQNGSKRPASAGK